MIPQVLTHASRDFTVLVQYSIKEPVKLRFMALSKDTITYDVMFIVLF